MLNAKNQDLKKEIARLEACPAGKIEYLHYAGFAGSEGRPMTIRRACAFRSLLEQCEKHIYENDRIAGSAAGLSGAVHDPAAEEKIEYVRNLGERTFATHSDHAAPNYAKLMKVGIGGLLDETAHSLGRLEQLDKDLSKKKDFLESVRISLEAFSAFIAAYAQAAKEKKRPQMQKTCQNISIRPPRNFEEALTLTWLVFEAFTLEGRYAMAFGRMDQYLIDFYWRDLSDGRIKPQDALELLEQVFLKIGERKYLLGGDDVANICVGGVTPDGGDGTNELSYLIIEAVKNCQIPGPNLTVRVHPGTPDDFYKKCLDSIRTGLGYPAISNDQINVTLLERRGYDIRDARDYCFAGCIENFLQGKQPPWSDGRYDTPKYLEYALNDGKCMLTGKQIGLHTGDPQSFSSFEQFFDAFREQCVYGVTRHMDQRNANCAVVQSRPEDFTSPFLSAFFDDCIARAKDINDGGTKYPSNYGVGVMGIATVADSLAAIEKLVYREKKLTMKALTDALKADFEGCGEVRGLLLGAPKYGNDLPEVDRYAVWFAKYFKDLFDRYRTYDGGFIWIGIAANTNNISSGYLTAATPDGRKARAPLSDAGSPTYGADKNGPTAVINSITRVDYTNSEVGSVLNQKFSPSLLDSDEKLDKMTALLKTYFQKGGQEIQINIIDTKTLRDAMAHPENYPNLMIRVSGFSARFVELDRSVQLDIIARTEHMVS